MHVGVVAHALRVHGCVGHCRPRYMVRVYNDVLVRRWHCLTVVLNLSFEVLRAHSRIDKVRFIASQFTVSSTHSYCLFRGFCGHRLTLNATVCLFDHGIVVLLDCLRQLLMLDAQVFIRCSLLHDLWAVLRRCKLELLGRAYQAAWHVYIAITICVDGVLGDLQRLAVCDYFRL